MEENLSKMTISPEVTQASGVRSSKLSPFSKKKWWILILVLLILGGGVYFVLAKQRNPEEVISKMFQKMSRVKSFAYGINGSFEINMPPSDSSQKGEKDKIPGSLSFLWNLENLKISVKIQGKTDIHNINSPRSTASYEVNGSSDGLEIGFAGESIVRNKEYYFKWDRLPTLPVPGLDFSQLKGQWYGLGEKEIKEMREMYKKTGEEPKEKPGQKVQLEKEIEEIGQLIEKNKPWKIKRLKDEVIQNEKCYHFQISLRKEGALKLIDELTKRYNKEISSENKKKIGEILSRAESYPLDAWIAKKGYYLKKILFQGTFEIPADKKSGKIKANIEMIYSQFNQTFNIEAPKQYKSIEELMKQMSGGIDLSKKGKDSDFDGLPDEWETKYGLNSDDSSDANKDKDKDELSNFEEYSYGTDPTNPDTDGDGYKDGTEVEAGYNPNGPGKLK